MTEQAAAKALDAKGFTVVVEAAFSAKIERGHAIASDPPAGTAFPPGETVVLTVSLGPEYFDCPDFVGMSVEGARTLAERFGLKLTALEVPGSGGSDVVSQIPQPGTRIRYGSTVTVYYA